MKKLILVSLLSCLVVGDVFCGVRQDFSEREKEGLLVSGYVGSLLGAVPIVFCAAVGSAIASVSGLSSRSGSLLGGLFGSLVAGGIGIEIIRHNVPQNQAQTSENELKSNKLRGCGLGMCAVAFVSCLGIACMSNS